MVDRVIVYPQALPRSVDILSTNKNALYAIGYLAQATLGNNTAVQGLVLAQTGVASLSVVLSAGSIYALTTVDATAYGSLSTDSNSVIKQGILAAPLTLGPITPPGSAGNSQVFLVQVAYQDTDGGSQVLPYYNSTNPSVPFAGPGNLGTSNYTLRQGALVVSLKAGVIATTGSQVTPAPDGGFTALYAITVSNGQTAITSLNWVIPSTAPFIPVTLPGVPTGVQNASWTYAVGTGTASALVASVFPAPTALVAGMQVSIKSPFTNGGASTFNLNGLGVKSIVARDNTALNPGDIANGGIIDLRYNGVAWQLVSDRSTAFTFSVPDNSLWHIGSATGGTANALTTTLAPVPSAATNGLCFRAPITATNTGAATIDFGFGPKPIVQNTNGAALTGAEMFGGTSYEADFIYDGTNARLINPRQTGRLLSTQTFSTAGTFTYTPNPLATSVVVTVTGGGGGSGGAGATTGSQVSVGGSGGGGATAKGRFTSSFAGVTVTVGAGGAAGPAGATFGVAGSTSSFGSLCTAQGGSGGFSAFIVASGSNKSVQAAPGGTTTAGGNIFSAGGGCSQIGTSNSSGDLSSGSGGSSYYGGGAMSSSSTGNTGTAPGSGASGTVVGTGGTNSVGAAGAAGIVIVEEYA